jgi:hypothetical protein
MRQDSNLTGSRPNGMAVIYPWQVAQGFRKGGGTVGEDQRRRPRLPEQAEGIGAKARLKQGTKSGFVAAGNQHNRGVLVVGRLEPPAQGVDPVEDVLRLPRQLLDQCPFLAVWLSRVRVLSLISRLPVVD